MELFHYGSAKRTSHSLGLFHNGLKPQFAELVPNSANVRFNLKVVSWFLLLEVEPGRMGSGESHRSLCNKGTYFGERKEEEKLIELRPCRIKTLHFKSVGILVKGK